MTHLVFRDVAKKCGVNVDSQDAQMEFYKELSTLSGLVTLDAKNFPVVDGDKLEAYANEGKLDGKLAPYATNNTDAVVEADKAPEPQQADEELVGEDELDDILDEAEETEALSNKLGKPQDEPAEEKLAKAAKPKKVAKKAKAEEPAVQSKPEKVSETSVEPVSTGTNGDENSNTEIVISGALLRKTFGSLAAAHRAVADLLENLSEGVK